MKNKFIIHPILFAIFPALALYSHNMDLAQFSYFIWPMIFSFLFAVILFAILKIFIKNIKKTAIITSLILMQFFTYGHLLAGIPDNFIFGTIINNYFILSFFEIIIFISISAVVLTSKNKLNITTYFLNNAALMMVLISLFNIGLYQFKNKNISITLNSVEDTVREKIVNKKIKKMPDIYHIVLDGYGRQDILEKMYNYDNSEFINYLSNKGFYVADQSHSNYPQTYLSISSCLNFDYINYLSKIMGEKSADRRPLKKLLKDNKVHKILKKYGYKFVTTPSIWAGTNQNLYSDIELTYENGLNEFDIIFLNTTPLSILFGKNFMLDSYRKKILYSFEHVPDIAKIDSPTFVYVHFLASHPPFVFDRDGQPITPGGNFGLDARDYSEAFTNISEYKKKFMDITTFLNKKIEIMIDNIIKNSETPPIIILQSDHGPGLNFSWEHPETSDMSIRMSILNAYYVPHNIEKNLYSSITPINTYRLILNGIIGSNYDLLEDKSYFASWNKPYKFIDVTDRL